jgi:hypothetical protein
MSRILKVLSNVATGNFERSLKCEACGNDFKCGASLKGCWCSEVNLNDADRASIRSRYKDCLCRDCLELAATRNQVAIKES